MSQSNANDPSAVSSAPDRRNTTTPSKLNSAQIWWALLQQQLGHSSKTALRALDGTIQFELGNAPLVGFVTLGDGRATVGRGLAACAHAWVSSSEDELTQLLQPSQPVPHQALEVTGDSTLVETLFATLTAAPAAQSMVALRAGVSHE